MVALINTTHDRVIRTAPPTLPHLHTRIPRAQRNPGSISPCFHVSEIPVSAIRSSLGGLTDLRTRQTRNSAPELPPHTTPPRAGLDYPHHYPPPPPFVSRHQAHTGISVSAS